MIKLDISDKTVPLITYY